MRSDAGIVYVVRSGERYKLGFTRSDGRRRARDAQGELIISIPVKQRPSVLEYILNKRFAHKRLPPQGNKPGDKREWFSFDESDLEWLRGLASFLS